MKASVVATITIAASCEQVFKYLSHLKYHHLWNPHMQDIASSGLVKPDMVYETTHILLGVRLKAKNHVLKLVPDREFEVENTTGSLDNHVNIRLTTRGKRTLVTCTTTVSTRGEAFAFTKPVLKLLVRRELQSDLQSLKIAVEHGLS